jgi:hypothetical protein
VIPAARTGSDSSNKKAVIKTARTDKGILCMRGPGALIFAMVAMELIAPKIDEIPARCKLEIAKSTALSDTMALRGG